MPAITTHPVFAAPPDINIPIWRYMDFTKYVSMLDRRALYFARADQLGDPFEGSTSKANLALRPEVYKDALSPEMFEVLGQALKNARNWTFINCWHINVHESAAMWRLYSQGPGSIAVKSSYAKLAAVLPDNVYLGAVKYIDYSRDWLPENNLMWPIVHKRRSFQHEQELRAVISEFSPTNPVTSPESGKLVPVAIREMVEEIVVAPTAPVWFRELVDAVTRKYEFEFPVRQSELDDAPVF